MELSKGNALKLKASILLVLLASTIVCYGQNKSSDLYAVKLKKIRENVYVAYGPDPLRYFVEGNVTIIINEQDVVVVDGGGAPLKARNIIAEIRKLTSKPVRYLINTHDHVDHTLGNQEYVKAFPGIDIITTPRPARAWIPSDASTLQTRLRILTAEKSEPKHYSSAYATKLNQATIKSSLIGNVMPTRTSTPGLKSIGKS